jgi:hypothetical protein
MNARSALAWIGACLLGPLAAYAEDAAPIAELATELSPPLWIAVELAPEQSPQQWLARNGVGKNGDVFIQRLPEDGSLLSFPLDPAVWEDRRGDLCKQEGVRSCEVDLCRAFLAPEASGAEPSAAPPGDAPTLVRGMLRGASGRGAARASLARMRPSLSALLDAQEPARKDAPGQTQCSANDADFPARLMRAAIDSGGAFSFPSPAAGERLDPGCWEVVVTDLCSSRSLPLRDYVPEYEPGRLLVLIAATPPPRLQAVAQALAAAVGLTLIEAAPLPSLDAVLIRLAVPNLDTANVPALLATLAARPDVQLAQRELRYRTTAGYDDPRNFLNYGPPRMRADALHPKSRGAGVSVAVIDSGIDREHPELDGRVIESVDTTGFGASADLHGTAIAGIIAARENNGIGAYGVAPGASILSYKACQPEERGRAEARCWSSTIAKALDRAVRSEARIVNLSLGGPEDPLIARLLARAAQQGKVVVAAAGNGGPEARPAFPAAYPDVVAVTAIDAADQLYPRATHGDFLDLAAPGVEVVVVDPSLSYPVLSGTSMAAASASGALALILGLAPQAPAAQLSAALRGSAVDLGKSGPDADFGAGRIDVGAAAAALAGGTDPCSAVSAPPAAAATTAAPEPPAVPASEPPATPAKEQ